MVQHIVEFRGDFACFTGPLKTERWSLPCPTPSAGRGMLDSIYLKPREFRWQLTKIELLSIPSYVSLRRNEVGKKASVTNITKWMKPEGKPAALVADDPAIREQRQMMALRNPKFRIHARILPREGFERHQRAFDEQFVRRAENGKCWMQPSLGMREAVAFFRLIDDMASEPLAAPIDQDLGFIVYDVFDLDALNPGRANQSGSGTPSLVSVFHAVIRSGVLVVPDFHDPAVLKPARRAV